MQEFLLFIGYAYHLEMLTWLLLLNTNWINISSVFKPSSLHTCMMHFKICAIKTSREKLESIIYFFIADYSTTWIYPVKIIMLLSSPARFKMMIVAMRTGKKRSFHSQRWCYNLAGCVFLCLCASMSSLANSQCNHHFHSIYLYHHSRHQLA